jgi:hypothetical protein
VQSTYLAFHEVPNAGFSHDGDGHCLHDLLDHGGVGHARDATLDADIGGDTLEGHDGSSTSFFGDAGLGLVSGLGLQLNGIDNEDVPALRSRRP